MKIIHILKDTNEKFYDSYIKFVNKNFAKEDHQFYIENYINNTYKDLSVNNNVKYINKTEYIKLINGMNKADKIILHGLFSPRLLIILFFLPNLLKKCCWVIWGGDLYYHETRKKTLSSNIYEYLRKRNIKRFKGIATLVTGDLDLVKKWYGTTAKYYKAIYAQEQTTVKNMNLIRSNEKKEYSNIIRILIGNSATITNKHAEILHTLCKYKDKPIEIYCPLSYGDESYAKEIRKTGKELFGDKFHSIDKFVPKNEYLEILNDMNIGIFNNNRQQAMGTIFMMIYLGKKVYLREETTMWEEIKNDMKMNVYGIKNIESENYTQFIYNDIKAVNENIAILDNGRYNPEYPARLWNKIFYE